MQTIPAHWENSLGPLRLGENVQAAVYRVVGGDGRARILKGIEPPPDPAHLRARLDLLEGEGIPVAAPIPTDGGRLWVAHDERYVPEVGERLSVDGPFLDELADALTDLPLQRLHGDCHEGNCCATAR